MADVVITEFTDPGCPWAWSAEPFRRRLNWLYGDCLRWQRRMVVLAESPAEYEERGFTPRKQAAAFASIARDHGMPIDSSERPRMAASAPACRAVIAARLHAPEPEAEDALLRAFRVRNFSGELLDEDETVRGAARDAGLDPERLEAWMGQDDVERALRDDMAAAREPLPAARVLDDKLANWSGGRRYTCPSYEIVRHADGTRIAVPGFQPFAAYDVVTANLVPGTDRREPATSVQQVLEWAGEPLASREVAVVCDVSHEDAREQLGRVAQERHVGFDGFWTLSG
ncbi:MAG: DsbA family protein [Solirubrobacterales bacterium]|nr:DsbA family protein [Solirubrobacterales bacterium]